MVTDASGDEHADGPGGEPIRCVGAAVYDLDGRLLLVRRGHAPDAGRWSLPGGRVEADEDDHAALRRELAEETGLRVSVGTLLGEVRRPAPSGGVYLIRDYRCAPLGGEPRAGDDAAELRWVTRGELAELPTTSGLVEALTAWQALPDGPS